MAVENIEFSEDSLEKALNVFGVSLKKENKVELLATEIKKSLSTFSEQEKELLKGELSKSLGLEIPMVSAELKSFDFSKSIEEEVNKRVDEIKKGLPDLSDFSKVMEFSKGIEDLRTDFSKLSIRNKNTRIKLDEVIKEKDEIKKSLEEAKDALKKSNDEYIELSAQVQQIGNIPMPRKSLTTTFIEKGGHTNADGKKVLSLRTDKFLISKELESRAVLSKGLNDPLVKAMLDLDANTPLSREVLEKLNKEGVIITE